MNYDENIFKEKANRKARKIWLIFALLLSANYGSDVANGLQKADYYIIFLILCWLWYLLYFCCKYHRFSHRLYLYPAGDEPAGSLQKQAFHDKLRHCEFHHYYRQCCISLHERI